MKRHLDWGSGHYFSLKLRESVILYVRMLQKNVQVNRKILATPTAQGLRIAPPEAPVTGYMFGKGVYFADMVSKSANYCCTTRSNNIGLLLLCEVRRHVRPRVISVT